MAVSAHTSTGPAGVGPVRRAFALLQLVVAAGEPIGVRELARRADLSRATTGRMLGILAELGMVERTAAGLARPGAGLAALTASADRSPAVLRDRLRPLAHDLLRRYGENAAAGVDDGGGFLYVVSARVPAAVQVADPVDATFPFHLVAPGLVCMAWWPPARLDAHLAAGPLSAATDHSVVAPRAIRGRLRAIRQQGHAWTDQELDLEVNGLAVPILHDGALVAVATLYGPSYRFAPDVRPELGADVAAFVAEHSVTRGIGPVR